MTQSSHTFSRVAKRIGELLSNTLAALLVPTLFPIGIFHLSRFHSLPVILWANLAVSVVIAGLTGWSVYQRFESTMAKWVWVVPSLAFGAVLNMFLNTGLRGAWSQLSGSACIDSPNIRCFLPFFDVTLPFVRGIMYSIGAYAASLYPSGLHSAARTGDVGDRTVF